MILVLLALVAIATPFALSMRNHVRTSGVREAREKASQSLRTALAAGETALMQTDPSTDADPHFDSIDELKVDVAGEMKRFGASLGDPTATIASAQATDEQGKIDVNFSSPFLLSNLMQPMRLASDLQADQTSDLAVDSTTGMPDSGMLVIDGEIVLYGARTESRFTDLKRGFSTTVVASGGPAVHKAGTAVIDYRCLLAAMRNYKVVDGQWIGIPSVRALKDIARFDEVAFTSDQLDAFEPDLTAYAVRPGGSCFVGEARVVHALAPGQGQPQIQVSGGRNLNAGSVVRIRGKGHVEYNYAIDASETGADRVVLTLLEPLRYAYGEDEALVSALVRAPVNVNTCSERVLRALLEGLRFKGSDQPLDKTKSTRIAQRIREARPIQGEPGLAALLDQMKQAGELEDIDQRLVLLNAQNALDTSLAFSTAPFCYQSYGTFALQAGVSENLPAGRESAHAFAREIVAVAPGGSHSTVFSSQIDFFEQQRLSRSSKWWTSFPNNVLEFDRWNQPPTSVNTYVEQKRYPDAKGDQKEPYARLAPTRKDGYRDAAAEGGAPRVIHFDENSRQGAQWNTENQDGWNTEERGVLSLPVDDPKVNLKDVQGRIQPFCIELWVIPSSGGDEKLIFDTGESEISNRILAYITGQKLIFRVADATFPDSGSATAQGGATPAQTPTQMAEIQYAFDDGLPYEADMPYHVTFYARGTKPSDMALFVDGVPRGKRAFQTRLSADLATVQTNPQFGNIQGYTAGSNTTIQVEDATLFPSYGVVRIGDELIEYTSRTDKALLVQPSQGSPFGGRARRGSTGAAHRKSECVELYGYAATLISQSIPNGDSQLASPIGDFAVAMVDPEAKEAKSQIAIQINVAGVTGSLPVGTGLSEIEGRIPIVPLKKPKSAGVGGTVGGSAIDKAFQKEGGFALLISSPTPPPSDDPDVNVKLPGNDPGDPNKNISFGWSRSATTTKGGVLGKGEVIYYSSFDGKALENVKRCSANFVSQFKWEPTSNLDKYDDATFGDLGNKTHAHICEWNPALMLKAGANQHDRVQPIFVVPISINVGKTVSAAANQWATPEQIQSQGKAYGQAKVIGTRPEMVQLGVGFTGSGGGGAVGGGGTEWVRYDTIANGVFVRDNPWRLGRCIDVLGRNLTWQFTGKTTTAPDAVAVAKAVDFEHTAKTEDEREKIEKAAKLASGELMGGILAFRGVLDTGSKAHPQGERVLPVFRTVRDGEIYTARPGARDFVTLIDPAVNGREEHRINYAYCDVDVEGWSAAACHVALEAGVDGNYQSNYYNLLKNIDIENEDAGLDALANEAIESRDLTRMLKFPSGELPLQVGNEINFGGDLQGVVSPSPVTLDEIEFFTPATPTQNLPRNIRYVLNHEDLNNGELHVAATALRYNWRTRSGLVIQAIDPVNNLPKDGFVVLLGDELIAVKEIRAENTEYVFEIAPNGRGYLGTPIQVHPPGEAIRDLCFLRVSRLRESLSATDHVLKVQDASDFDQRCVVQLGRELIGVTRREQNDLFMPPWTDASGTEQGLLRGSYGTKPDGHAKDTLVYQFPARYLDRYRPLADDPELGGLALFVPAKGGFFKELTWAAEGTSEKADVVVQARVGGRGEYTQGPKGSADVFEFDQPATQGHKNTILRQGDGLELRAFIRYRDGAFDSRVFEPDPGDDRGGSNDWKRAPHLKAVGVEWIAQPARLAYEEWQ